MWRPARPEPRERNRLRDADLQPVKFRQVAAAGYFTVAISAPPDPGSPEAAAAEALAAVAAELPPANLVSTGGASRYSFPPTTERPLEPLSPGNSGPT